MTITFFSSFANAFGQLEVEIPTQFSTYTNDEYGIQLEYPSEWKIFEDRVPGDYVTDIAFFVPSSEINFLFHQFQQWVNIGVVNLKSD